jgi:hypothetical protein
VPPLVIKLQGEAFAFRVEPFLAAALVTACAGGRQARLGTLAEVLGGEPSWGGSPQ